MQIPNAETIQVTNLLKFHTLEEESYWFDLVQED